MIVFGQSARADDKYARSLQLVELMERACLSTAGGSAEAGVKLSVTSLKDILKKGITGAASAEASAKEVRGAIGYVDEKLRDAADDKIRDCMAPTRDAVLKMFTEQDKPSSIELWFKYAFTPMPGFDQYSDFKQVVLGMKTPQTSQERHLAREPNMYFTREIRFPYDPEKFEGWISRVVTDSVASTEEVPQTYLCLTNREPAPARATDVSALLSCKEGGACSFEPRDLGWLRQCQKQSWLPSFDLIAPAAAQAPRSATWRIPAVETLDRRWRTGDLAGSGFTAFMIEASDLSAYKADSFIYRIAVNGVPVLVDGLAPQLVAEPMRNPASLRRQPFEFEVLSHLAPTMANSELELIFALQNLNFAGVEAGCDRIAVAIQLMREGKPVGPEFRLDRSYVALRDAPAAVAVSGGHSFVWQGVYVRPFKAYDREVFVNSIQVSSVENRESMSAARATMNELKGSFDRVGVQAMGLRAVGVIRPPLSNNSFGLAVGLVEPSQQIRFTFDRDTAEQIKRQMLELRGQNAVASRVIRPDAFIYPVNKDTQSPAGICAGRG